MQVPEYKNKPYFIVASVEMGNTTTKCILTGVSLETGMSYVINKTVSMSRDIRPPNRARRSLVQPWTAPNSPGKQSPSWCGIP